MCAEFYTYISWDSWAESEYWMLRKWWVHVKEYKERDRWGVIKNMWWWKP